MSENLETSNAMIIPSEFSISDGSPQKEINNNQLEIVFDFSVGTGKILQTFATTGQEMGFSLIEQQVNNATIIKRNKKGFIDMINCFSSDLPDSDVTAIKLTLKTNESNSTRVCKIRGLVGSKADVRIFMNKFELKAKQLRNYKSLFEQDFVENTQQQPNPMHTQVIASYSFYKILSMENYGLGRRLAQMLQNYKKKYENVEETIKLLPKPIQAIHEIVNWAVQSLFKEFNAGRKEMERIMPYCRVSVQKYVCEKLIPVIYPVYIQNAKARDEQLCKKKAIILNTRTVQQIFEDVCLSRKFWLVKDIPPSFKSPITSQKLLSNRRIIPFYRGSQQLQRLPHIMSLRQKIKHCQLMYTSIKSSVFSFHAGKQELNNMEDILPVMMMIILISDVENLGCEIEMMNDFMSLESWEGESQKRLLINLRESLNYIARDWKVE